MSQVKKYNEEELKELLENSWLNLGDTSKIFVENPLQKGDAYDVENPHIHLLNIMRNPDNFSFTCKHILNKTLLPFQLAILRELWIRPFPMLLACRGGGKSFILGVYAMLRALLCQGSKIVVVGASFRQSKIIFEYCDEIWRNAPVLRDLVGDNHEGVRNGPRRDIDRCTMRIGQSLLTSLPIGDGSKIRGQRANIILADEFASIPVEIFENVISGFAAVSMSPIEKVKAASREKAMIDSGLYKANENYELIPGLSSNQTVLTGTAYYSFNHFAAYWKRWKSIIESKGDEKVLEEIFNGEIPEQFNWKDYSVIRIPVDMFPPGFMDIKTVSKAKATIHPAQYLLEYAACFTGDSNGFFRRSLIESCVAGLPTNNISLPSCANIAFSASLKGREDKRYIMGVDPASEQDNFSVVILELWPDHRRIVHCWTTTRAKFKDKLKRGVVRDGQDEFYGFAARKIRDLVRLFPCERICLDSQGGGVAVLGALSTIKNILSGERPILEVRDPDKPKDTDNQAGDHIVEMINFANANWVSSANHGMRQDLENKTLLFPCMDSAELGMAYEEDKAMGRVKITNNVEHRIYDTLEDCVMEIEELKDELATIVHSQTGTTLRDRWDTPETKLPGNKKGRLRKDRYSSLLMANAVARDYQAAPIGPRYSVMGGFAHDMQNVEQNPKTVSEHQNPDWYNQVVMRQGYGAVVSRR